MERRVVESRTRDDVAGCSKPRFSTTTTPSTSGCLPRQGHEEIGRAESTRLREEMHVGTGARAQAPERQPSARRAHKLDPLGADRFHERERGIAAGDRDHVRVRHAAHPSSRAYQSNSSSP